MSKVDGPRLGTGEGQQKSSSPAPPRGSQVGRARGPRPSSPSAVGSKRKARGGRGGDEGGTRGGRGADQPSLAAREREPADGEAPADCCPARAKENQPPPLPAPPELEAKPQGTSKPPYSFNCLISMAIEGSPAQCSLVKEIYQWILDRYPYFKRAPVGGKNSVRHNLSLNRCFKRVEKQEREALGKCSFWCIDAESRPNLLQAIRKRSLCLHSPALGRDPVPPPLRGDVCLSSQTPSRDHNSSLVRTGEWEGCPQTPSDRARDRLCTFSTKLGHNGDEASEGFLSGSESEMEDSWEDEGAEDSLADSGLVPRRLRDPPATEGSEGSLGKREVLGISEIDEELKEVAGSLLNLAGIRSTCLGNLVWGMWTMWPAHRSWLSVTSASILEM
ncbi:forkhead box protein N2-like [Heptranchias perlo]|uniref:forkhead box protein N2-like n=1 Tax=Heptranchias perlo TaxID=212740 RepID=UPI00355A6F62